MITLQITTADGKLLGTVVEKSVGELDGPIDLVKMLQRMMRVREMQSIAGFDGWSNGYLVIGSVSQPLPGPAEDNRPRKIGGQFSTKGPPVPQ